jgi:hypothetical protein
MAARWAIIAFALAGCRSHARATGDAGWATPFADDPSDGALNGIAVAPLPPEEIEIANDTRTAPDTLLGQLRALGTRCAPLPKDHFPHVELTLVLGPHGRVEASEIGGWGMDGEGTMVKYELGPDSFLECLMRGGWSIGPFPDEHDRTLHVDFSRFSH